MSLKALEIFYSEIDELNTKLRKLPNGHWDEKSIIERRKILQEAIEELEQYEQNFKQKEFDYRTKCQNIVSAARLEADDIAKGGFINTEKFTEDTLQVIKELENQNTFYKSIGYESDGTE